MSDQGKSPAIFQDDHDIILLSAYPDSAERIDIKTMIIKHIDYLNDRGQFDAAHTFLNREIEHAKKAAQSNELQRRRERLSVIVNRLILIIFNLFS